MKVVIEITGHLAIGVMDGIFCARFVPFRPGLMRSSYNSRTAARISCKHCAKASLDPGSGRTATPCMGAVELPTFHGEANTGTALIAGNQFEFGAQHILDDGQHQGRHGAALLIKPKGC